MENSKSIEYAYLGGGCFWGVEYYMRKLNGVINVTSGYMSANYDTKSTYQQVCSGNGDVEVVEVAFNPDVVSYEQIVKMFMEIHDPTQVNGQGPDIGLQYVSMIYYTSPQQQETAQKVITELQNLGYEVATKVVPTLKFWPAEEYHQDYYARKGTQPYCHGYVKRFND
ncbi:MAG: peptide-methionine (S)-S-oxide reductase MsrA [Marinifilaceae bacterium]